MQQITIRATIEKPVAQVWESYTSPEHITQWNFASDDWKCPEARNDLRVGGKYFARMEAKDGSYGFDFEATYTEVVMGQRFAYVLDDGREVTVSFESVSDQKTKVTIVFDAEEENSIEMQREGWQAILDTFKHYTETSL